MNEEHLKIAIVIAVAVIAIVLIMKGYYARKRMIKRRIDHVKQYSVLRAEYKQAHSDAIQIHTKHGGDSVEYLEAYTKVDGLSRELRARDESISRDNCRMVGNYEPQNRGNKHEFDCSCGRKIIVWTNNYGQGNTGKGSCECGAEMYIN